MGNYLCEMFAHFEYGEQLTYQELLDREDLLTRDTQSLWEQFQAAHINYTPMGDALMVQCVFRRYDPQLFHDICDTLHPLLCQNVTGRLLFVDKCLNSLHVYSLTEQGWSEAPLRIPPVDEALPFADPPTPRTSASRALHNSPQNASGADKNSVAKKRRLSKTKISNVATAPPQ